MPEQLKDSDLSSVEAHASAVSPHTADDLDRMLWLAHKVAASLELHSELSRLSMLGATDQIPLESEERGIIDIDNTHVGTEKVALPAVQQPQSIEKPTAKPIKTDIPTESTTPKHSGSKPKTLEATQGSRTAKSGRRKPRRTVQIADPETSPDDDPKTAIVTNPNAQLASEARNHVTNVLKQKIRSGSFGIDKEAVKQRRRSRRDTSGYEGKGKVDLVRMYLNDIGQYELLTKEKEFVLAQRMRRGREATLKMMLDGLRGAHQLPAMYTPEEKDPTLIIDGLEAKDQMYNCNLRLVVSIAKRYKGLDLLDLIQEGNTGLAHAIDLFDENKGFKFSTYATWWIKQAIKRSISNSSRTIRLSINADEVSQEVLSLARRNTPIEEIATRVGKSIGMVEGIIATDPARASSFDQQLREDSDTTLAEVTGDAKSSQGYERVDEQVVSLDLISVIQEILDERESEIIILRFGLDKQDGEGQTLEEIGAHFELTRERIRQIESRALSKLKHPSVTRRLQSVNFLQ